MIKPQDAVAAALAFREAVKGRVVSPEEIIRRAGICGKCPKRERGGGILTRISRFLGDLANKHRVPESISKYHCGVCKCSFMLLLPATPEDLHKDTPKEAKQRPVQCWFHKLEQ